MQGWGFSFQLCDVAIQAIIHKELSKFATCQKRKVKTFQNPAIFWQPAETYCVNMMISGKKIFLQIWQLWITLFTNVLCMSCTGLSFVTK